MTKLNQFNNISRRPKVLPAPLSPRVNSHVMRVLHTLKIFICFQLQKKCKRQKRYVTFINSRLPEFNMTELYNLGGWITQRQNEPHPRYSKWRLFPFSFCKDKFKNFLGSVKHNVACAALAKGSFKDDVMSTIFHFFHV